MKLLLRLSLVVFSLSFPILCRAASPGTAFTYQGHLNEGGQPASGRYDFLFSLHDALTNGTQISSNVVVLAEDVINGSFNASVDFGPEAFTGGARWLEIEVRVTPRPSELSALRDAGPASGAHPHAVCLKRGGSE